MKVSVLCPAAYVTGGPEALHQLAGTAAALGYDASIVYFPAGHPEPTAEAFRGYGARVAPYVVDAPDAVVIAPETEVPQLLSSVHATRVLWWLSVDNFTSRNEALRHQHGLAAGPLDVVFDPRAKVVHAAQSAYAQQFLSERGQSSSLLTDFIRPEIVARSQVLRRGPKDDVVVYNPAKGMEFTRQLIAQSPSWITWVPMQGMSPAEVAQLLGRAKAYVDFGPHPGRDRIPREAALCGCAVVTGVRGSAGNPVDVPISPDYKVDQSAPDAVDRTLELLTAVLKEHDQHGAAFAGYRGWVEGQQATFVDEVFVTLSSLAAATSRRLRFAV